MYFPEITAWAPPRGEEDGRLWDGVLLVAATTGFHELKGVAPADPVY